MEGYEVITSDGQDFGRAVEVKGENLIVERGFLRKSRHAIPKTFAHADSSERVVRLSVTQDVVETSPKLEDDSVDERAVAQHYGLAAGVTAAETEGYGDLLPDDPARSTQEQELRTGVEPAESRRARIREGRSEAGRHGRQIIPADPHEGP